MSLDPFTFTEEQFLGVAHDLSKVVYNTLKDEDKPVFVALYAELKNLAEENHPQDVIEGRALTERLRLMLGISSRVLPTFFDNIPLIPGRVPFDPKYNNPTTDSAFALIVRGCVFHYTLLTKTQRTYDPAIHVLFPLRRWFQRKFDLYAPGVTRICDEMPSTYETALEDIYCEYADEHGIIATLGEVGFPTPIRDMFQQEAAHQIEQGHTLMQNVFPRIFANYGYPEYIYSFIERVYYERLQTAAPDNETDLVGRTRAALKRLIPVALMQMQPRGTRVQFVDFETCFSKYEEMIDHFENYVGVHNSLRGIHENILPQAIPFQDPSTWKSATPEELINVWGLFMMVRLCRNMETVASTDYNPGELPHKKTDGELMLKISRLPDEFVTKFIAQSDLDIPTDEINVKAVKFALAGHATWEPTVPKITVANIYAMICLIGFEAVREKQFSLLMSIVDLLGAGLVRFRSHITRGDPKHKVPRFLSIMSRLNPDITIKVAESYAEVTRGRLVAVPDVNIWGDKAINDYLAAKLPPPRK